MALKITSSSGSELPQLFDTHDLSSILRRYQNENQNWVKCFPDWVNKFGKLLFDNGCEGENYWIIGHAIAVSALSRRLAESIVDNGGKVDVDFVEKAAFLHDIGRGSFKSGDENIVEHGVRGAEILKCAGYSDEFCRVCLTHIGGGIFHSNLPDSPIWAKSEKLGFMGDHVPTTIEEKIVCYTDKLYHGRKKVDINQTIKRMEDKLGQENPTIKSIKKIHEEMKRLTKKDNPL